MPTNRKPAASCNICRERKVRCDKKRPCSSCIKHQTTNECVYLTDPIDQPHSKRARLGTSPPTNNIIQLGETQNGHSSEPLVGNTKLPEREGVAAGPRPDTLVCFLPSSNPTLLTSFTNLQEIVGVNPFGLGDHCINLYGDFLSISYDANLSDELNHGPLAWYSIVRTDPGLSQLWSFMMNTKPPRGLNLLPNVFMKAVKPNRGPTQLQALNNIRSRHAARTDSRSSIISPRKVPLGLSFDDLSEERLDSDIGQRLLAILPASGVVDMLIDRFFRYVYPFYPFLDETWFRKTLERIFVSSDDPEKSITQVFMTIKTDWAFVGIACIVLRLSYLSTVSNESHGSYGEFSKSEHHPMLLTPIGTEFLELAHHCLNHTHVSRHYNLPVLQLMTYMRIYMDVCPENVDGPSRDTFQVNNAVLMQMAYRIGLNREPRKMAQVLKSEQINHVRRKLWIHLQLEDVINCFKFGSPYSLTTVHSDTSFPKLTPNNGNCQVQGNDELVEAYMQPYRELLPLMRKTTNAILRIDEAVTVSSILADVNRLEQYAFKFLDLEFEGEPYAEKTHNTVLRARISLRLHVFFLAIYFKLSGLFEEANEETLSLFYIRKMATMITQKLLPFAETVLTQRHPDFDYAVQMVLNTHVDYVMHSSCGFMSAWSIRLGNQIALQSNYEDSIRLIALKSLVRTLTFCFKSCLMNTFRINHRYNFSWRVSVVYSYILSCITSRGFYELFKLTKSAVNVFRNFTNEQLLALSTFIEERTGELDQETFASKWQAIIDVINLETKNNGGKFFDSSATGLIYEDYDVNLALMPDLRSLDPIWHPDYDIACDFDAVMELFFEGGENPITGPEPKPPLVGSHGI